jgi:hypothetical protein
MYIAILVWGSLVWDPRDLPLKSEWQFGDPNLLIEPPEFTFCSTSTCLGVHNVSVHVLADDSRSVISSLEMLIFPGNA